MNPPKLSNVYLRARNKIAQQKARGLCAYCDKITKHWFCTRHALMRKKWMSDSKQRRKRLQGEA